MLDPSQTPPSQHPILVARNITKQFPGVKALSDVSVEVYPGEVVALMGENGAGKSTLGKILAGVQPHDGGELLIDGKPVVIHSVRDAQRLGVAMIHQELNLADNLTVAQNLFLGREPRGFGFVIDRTRIQRDAAQLLERAGFDLPPNKLVSELSVGQQQLVEIAKALAANARIIMMDEPTSSLSSREAERLFQVICDLRSRGVSIIYVSHRLGEVKRLANRVVVLRDGKNAGELSRERITHDAMVRLMVGRELSQHFPHTSHPPGAAALEVHDLRTRAYPGHSVSFTIHSGEIVALAGLVGAGRSEVLRATFGIDKPLAGAVTVEGQPITTGSPVAAIKAGVALVPEDRKAQGLFLEMAVRENLALPSLRVEQTAGVVHKASEKRISADAIKQLAIKTPSDRQIAQYLSGGNQQKIVLGKWMALNPRVLLLDEPTRGIDVGAKREIYQLMENLARQGVAILFVSSEMEEVLGMADRVLVMHEGALAGELARDGLSEEVVMHLATGASLAPS